MHGDPKSGARNQCREPRRAEIGRDMQIAGLAHTEAAWPGHRTKIPSPGPTPDLKATVMIRPAVVMVAACASMAHTMAASLEKPRRRNSWHREMRKTS